MVLQTTLTSPILQGYNQYNFPEALWQIEKSTQILEKLLNTKHVFIAASWRLKALLLEGLAANTDNEQVTCQLMANLFLKLFVTRYVDTGALLYHVTTLTDSFMSILYPNLRMCVVTGFALQ